MIYSVKMNIMKEINGRNFLRNREKADTMVRWDYIPLTSFQSLPYCFYTCSNAVFFWTSTTATRLFFHCSNMSPPKLQWCLGDIKEGYLSEIFWAEWAITDIAEIFYKMLIQRISTQHDITRFDTIFAYCIDISLVFIPRRCKKEVAFFYRNIEIFLRFFFIFVILSKMEKIF